VIKLRQLLIILLTFLCAWMLMLFPIPYDWYWLKPAWLSLVLIYWIFTLPQNVGMVTAWGVGLVLDILEGGILGRYALAMVVVAFLARLLRYRLKFFPFWQQALAILLIVGSGSVVLFLVQWLTGHPPRTLLYWVPTLVSVLLWPVVYRVLRRYAR